MTEVSFHFNVPDRAHYACRLLRKVTRQGRAVVVTGPAATLGALDRALWSFEPLEFLPHVYLRPGAAPAGRLRATPIWLMENAANAPHHDVLVNLGAEAPEGFESFARLVEIVSAHEAERADARLRWKHYASRGYAIQKHEVGE